MKSLNLENLVNISEGALFNYIYNSLKNKAIDFLRKYVLVKNDETAIDLDIPTYDEDMDEKLFVENLFNLDILTSNQKEILKQSYLYENSDTEIAKKLHISRQAVNKTRRNGLAILREYLITVSID